MNPFKKNGELGFTLIEILAVIATFAVLIAVLVPALAKHKHKKERIRCVSHLKQIGLSFRIWAGDGGDRYPMAISTNEGGTMEFIQTSQVFRHFQILSNELGTANILVCPADRERKSANSFQKISNTNLSYFLGPDANENLPQSILSGDGNITNGLVPTNGMLVVMTNQPVGWTKDIHKYQGNVALGDGSVQQVSSARLGGEIIVNSDLATNRIQLP